MGDAPRGHCLSVEEISRRLEPGLEFMEYIGSDRLPLVSFNLEDAEQLKIACHFTNLQPMWAFDNLSKGGKVQDDVRQ